MRASPLGSTHRALAGRTPRRTPVRPNHLTSLSLALGVGAGVLFALGDGTASNVAAALFMLAVLLDHTDGELARLSGRGTRPGAVYDYISGCAIYTVLFLGLGAGAARVQDGPIMPLLGLCVAFAMPIVTALLWSMERRLGTDAIRRRAVGGFESEDFVYLIGPITWIFGSQAFLLVYVCGALSYFVCAPVAFVALGRHRTHVQR